MPSSGLEMIHSRKTRGCPTRFSAQQNRWGAYAGGTVLLGAPHATTVALGYE